MEYPKFLNALKMVVIFMKLLCSSYGISNSNLKRDLKQLATALPGYYSNAKQYYTHGMDAFRHHKQSLFLLHAEFYLLQSSFFNDSLTIYFQDFTKSSTEPFSSGFYVFKPDVSTNTIRMKMYKLKEPVPGLVLSFADFVIPNGTKEDQQLRLAFNKVESKTHASCDMLWQRISPNAFMGVTRSQCLAALGKEKVRISVSMTLTGSRITLTEGWYNVDDRARLRELKIPYILKRNSSPPSNKSPHKSNLTISKSNQSKRWTDKKLASFHRLGKTKYFYPAKDNMRFVPRKMTSSSYQNTEARKRTKTYRKRKILRSFRHVKSRLLSGQKVFYQVDLTGCSAPRGISIQRLVFGGDISTFLVIRDHKQSGKRRTKIYFSSTRASMGLRGLEWTQRELTVHRGGQVEVKITKRFLDPWKLQEQFTFQCKLFKNKKRRGGVKLLVDQASQPKQVDSLTQITRSLSRGRQLCVIADLNKCRGTTMSGAAVIIGSFVSDYDLVNKGKTLETFFPLDRVNSRDLQTMNVAGFGVQISKNGDVILTWIGDGSNLKRRFQFSHAYRCELANYFEVTSDKKHAGSIRVYSRE